MDGFPWAPFSPFRGPASATCCPVPPATPPLPHPCPSSFSSSLRPRPAFLSSLPCILREAPCEVWGAAGQAWLSRGVGSRGGGCGGRTGVPPWVPPTGRSHLASWKRSVVRGWYISRAAMRSKADGASMVTRDTTTLTCPECACPPESRPRGLPCPPSCLVSGRSEGGTENLPRTSKQPVSCCPEAPATSSWRKPSGIREAPTGRWDSGGAVRPHLSHRPAVLLTSGGRRRDPNCYAQGRGRAEGGWDILPVRGRELSRGLFLALVCLPFR